MNEKIVPYKEAQVEKKQQIEAMFDNIAEKYDFLNLSLSVGIDRYWRNQAANLAAVFKPKQILDVAAGTGDLSIVMSKIDTVEHVVGIDISEKMLEVGRKKIKKKQLSEKIELKKDDSEALSFESNLFDVVSVGFGVRNFQDLNKGLSEMFRVLKPNGALVILEFSKPKVFPIKQLYHFYSFTLLPFLGKITSGDKSAYKYLPESIEAFPDGKDFLEQMKITGFTNLKQLRLTFGITTVYVGTKV